MSNSADGDSPKPGKYDRTKGQGKVPHGAEAFGELDPALVHQAITAVIRAGDAILVGTTRDGGAVAMQLYSGDALDKLYGATAEELAEVLQGVYDAAGAQLTF